MAYSTGSGDYIALMAAVLAHAVADGWLEDGGIGTGWPITKGSVRGIDWSTYTLSEADQTLGGDGLTKTQRYLRIGLGASGALATTDAIASSVVCPNFAYSMSEWHIFSEPALCDYIHVVFRFSNGASSSIYSMFSFGEVDSGGMGYGSVAYATARKSRGYAVSNASGSGAQDWNSINRSGNAFAGSWGEGDDGSAQLAINIHATNAPTPNATAGWPAWDVTQHNGNSVWGKIGRISADVTGPNTGGFDAGIDFFGWAAESQPFTGSTSLVPISVLLINGTSFTSRLRWVGAFPNVRKCSVAGFSAGDEITYGADTWKIFPLLAQTPNSDLTVAYKVTSGQCGYAFKKVP